MSQNDLILSHSEMVTNFTRGEESGMSASSSKKVVEVETLMKGENKDDKRNTPAKTPSSTHAKVIVKQEVITDEDYAWQAQSATKERTGNPVDDGNGHTAEPGRMHFASLIFSNHFLRILSTV